MAIILGELTLRAVRAVLRQFIANGKLSRTVLTGKADRGIALSVRCTFRTTEIISGIFICIRLKRILDSGLQASETRRLVDNHVVIT